MVRVKSVGKRAQSRRKLVECTTLTRNATSHSILTPLLAISRVTLAERSAIADTLLDHGWKSFRIAVAGRGQEKLERFKVSWEGARSDYEHGRCETCPSMGGIRDVSAGPTLCHPLVLCLWTLNVPYRHIGVQDYECAVKYSPASPRSSDRRSCKQHRLCNATSFSIVGCRLPPVGTRHVRVRGHRYSCENSTIRHCGGGTATCSAGRIDAGEG